MRFIVAIDGPAASGKSTTAHAVALRLGLHHLNSGELYRAITWSALEEGWIEDGERFETELGRLDLSLAEETDGGRELRARVRGLIPGAILCGPEVTARVSEVAARPCVRARVLALVREAAARFSLVCDGRDIGTVVFPEAALKVFLEAAPEERARRRLLEREGRVTHDALRREVHRLRKRDRKDATRDIAPLCMAENAVVIDTTELSATEVVDRIERLAQERMPPRRS